jgi:3-oxoacyl-[acyl-carrier-protein] synthase II
LWSGVTAGESAVRPVQSFDVSACGSRVAGEVLDFKPEDFLAQREVQAYGRFAHLGVAAARMAWEDAGSPNGGLDRDRVGVCIGSAVGAIGRAVNDGVTFFEKGLNRVHPMFSLQYPGTLSSQVAIAFGLRGPAYAVGTACTAGADAIGLGLAQVQSGQLDAAVVGGSDAPLFPLLFSSFDRIGALSKLNEPAERASRPFSADRSGFVLSEGAAILVIEAEEVARERGARIYAELAGFGATCDAFHHLAPAPEGEQGARAVRLALENANVKPEDVDYINAHGTSTPKNDVVETGILKRVFGEHAYRIPISSSKSMLGHLIGASGPTELIVSTLAIQHGLIPPTINMTVADPECDLDYVPEGARRAELRTVLSTSFGFGSRNAALVVRSMLQ